MKRSLGPSPLDPGRSRRSPNFTSDAIGICPRLARAQPAGKARGTID